MLDQQIHVRHAAAHVVFLVAAHHEQIGRRQHGHRHTGIGDPPRQRAQIGNRHGRELAHMPDRDASAEPVFLGQLADQMNVHVLRRISGIEMHVDIHIELARQIEHPVDLAGMVRIVVRRRADHLRRRASNASTSSASERGLLVRPSCGNTHTSTSIAQA